ncbi:MAG: DNA repair protein RadC [Vulcanimicrobiota bacterium]
MSYPDCLREGAPRPRERLLSEGPASLTDQELVAVLLGHGVKDHPVSRVAGLLVEEGLGRATADSLCRTPGVGQARAAALLAGIELGRRLAVPSGPRIGCPEDVFELLVDMVDYDREHFVALYLDARRRVIGQETVSVGTLTASLVHPREVFAPALQRRAATVVVAHNHPSGDPTPSAEDVALTRRLVRAGELLGVELLDHIVVGRWGFASIRELGEI